MQLTIVKQDKFGHDVLAVNASTIKAELKAKGMTGKALQQEVRDRLRGITSATSGLISQFVSEGGVLRSARATVTKDGRKNLSVSFSQPKVSEVERLRAEVAILKARVAGSKELAA